MKSQCTPPPATRIFIYSSPKSFLYLSTFREVSSGALKDISLIEHPSISLSPSKLLAYSYTVLFGLPKWIVPLKFESIFKLDIFSAMVLTSSLLVHLINKCTFIWENIWDQRMLLMILNCHTSLLHILHPILTKHILTGYKGIYLLPYNCLYLLKNIISANINNFQIMFCT